MSNVKEVSLDVSDCETPEDIYAALLAALEAPVWHGRNLDAVWDSVTDGINGLQAPYRLEVSGHENLPTDATQVLKAIRDIFEEARKKHGVAAQFILL